MLLETAPGVSIEEIRNSTEGRLEVASDVHEMVV
jgi:acyl CoA:acetate/3-ketoacid CoA transferase beta subunit